MVDMKTETIVRYVASAVTVFVLLHFVVLPGLERPNTVTQLLSLAAFFFLVFWSFGWFDVKIKLGENNNNKTQEK